MNCPSVKSLCKLGIDKQQATVLRDMMNRNLRVYDILAKANDYMDANGVEYTPGKGDEEDCWGNGIEYVNTGESYTATLIYDAKTGNYYVTTWSDVVERNAKRFTVGE